MEVRFNHFGRERIIDNDLLDARQAYGDILPWLPDLLEEIQFLRTVAEDASGQRIEYLEQVLDKLGATYKPATCILEE